MEVMGRSHHLSIEFRFHYSTSHSNAIVIITFVQAVVPLQEGPLGVQHRGRRLRDQGPLRLLKGDPTPPRTASSSLIDCCIQFLSFIPVGRPAAVREDVLPVISLYAKS